MAKILVIDNSDQLLDMLTLMFRLNGHEIETAKGIVDTVKSIKYFSPDIILLDAGLGHNSGKELCKEIKKLHPTIPIILMCEHPDLLNGCDECKANDVIEKPFDIYVLKSKVNQLLVFKHA